MLQEEIISAFDAFVGTDINDLDRVLAVNNSWGTLGAETEFTAEEISAIAGPDASDPAASDIISRMAQDTIADADKIIFVWSASNARLTTGADGE